jgi:hypothetical protein
MTTHVSFLLNPSDLDERLHEGMVMSTPKFLSLTLLRICDPDPSYYGSDFCNLCAVMKSLPSTARTYVWLIANSLDNNCFGLLVGVVENWIHNMPEIFPKFSAGVPNTHLEFERRKETRMHAFANVFIAEYNCLGLSCLEDVSRITFGRLGTFLHLALFMAWSHAISDNQKLPIKFPEDCLIGKYALPVIYYVAGWMLYSASKASSIAADKRPYFSGLQLPRLLMDVLQKVWICQCLSWRGGNGGHRSIACASILTLCVLLKVLILPISR